MRNSEYKLLNEKFYLQENVCVLKNKYLVSNQLFLDQILIYKISKKADAGTEDKLFCSFCTNCIF